MSDVAIFEYEELNTSNHEIRILRFAQPDQRRPELINCSLQHVSLDGYRPEYNDFLKEVKPWSTSDARRRWLAADCVPTFTPWLKPNAPRPLVTSWRYLVDEQCPRGLVDIMGIDTSELPQKPRKRPGPPTLRSYTREQMIEFERIEAISKLGTVPIPPRYTWGDFEAISYCWESDVRDKEMLINGCIVKVTTSLDALLHHLQHLPEARSGMGFWVDGLCINQDKITEKNRQVQLMKRIYEQAFSVIAWIGPGNCDSNRAMDFIVQLADIDTDLRDDRVQKDNIESWCQHDDERNPQPWNLLLNFLSRNYFKRMWIIQELALNREMTLLMCGGRHIPREALTAACDLCVSIAGRLAGGLHENRLTETQRSDSEVNLWSMAFDILRLTGLSREHMSLDTVLDLARKAKVKDPRDKVYGLLGLLPQDLASAIVPDYSDATSTETVYIDFARAMLKQCKRLDEVLSWCTLNVHSNLPSWVPDWNIPFHRYHIRWFRRRNASGGAEPEVSFSDQGETLRCKGFVVDTINNLSVLSSQYLPYRATCTERSQEKISKLHYGKYERMSELRAALFRTLLHAHEGANVLGDLTEIYWIDWNQIEQDHSWDPDMQDFWTVGMRELRNGGKTDAVDTWEMFDQFRQTNADYSIFGHKLKAFFPDMRIYLVKQTHEDGYGKSPVKKWEHYPHELTEYHRHNMELATVASKGRRLITTESGYLGLAPDETEPDDVVAILYGCNYPAVLRRHGKGFKYVGECYIDGLMDGEAVKMQKEKETAAPPYRSSWQRLRDRYHNLKNTSRNKDQVREDGIITLL